MSVEIRPLFQDAVKPDRVVSPAPLTTEAPTVMDVAPTVIENRYLSVAEAADTLGVSRMTVYRMLREGRVRGTQVGRRLKVFAPDLAEMNRPKDLSRTKGVPAGDAEEESA